MVTSASPITLRQTGNTTRGKSGKQQEPVLQSSSFPYEEVEVLSADVAEAAAEFTDAITFTNLTQLNEAEAHILARHQGVLRFPALESLEPAVARALHKHEGFIDIRYLKTLNTDSVRLLLELMKGRGIIQLPYVEELHVEEALILAKHRGDLQFHGLQSITEEVAEALSRLPGNLLLGKDVEVDVGVARHLSKVGCGLMLCTPTLSDDVINVLAQSCYDLSLDGLTSLSSNAASSLSSHVGELFLDSLTSITEEAATLLSRHKGSVFLTGLSDNSKLSVATMEVLRSNPMFVLLGTASTQPL
jgi:hypothetical protein